MECKTKPPQKVEVLKIYSHLTQNYFKMSPGCKAAMSTAVLRPNVSDLPKATPII